jgi:hypothetical protein
MAVEFVGRSDGLNDAGRKARGVRRLRRPNLDDGKLIAAEARHGIGVANTVAQSIGDGPQQQVADRMPEGIVDTFEAVDIETQHRELLVAGLLQGVIQAVVEQHPIGQIGQRVVACHVRNLGLGAQPLRNILVGGHPAAPWDGMIQHSNGPSVRQCGQPLERSALPNGR